jgi:hypothetical protein
MNLKLTPTDPSSSLTPTSNGEGVHPRKMFLYGLLPIFSHNQSGLTYSVMACHIENPEGMPDLQRQTNPTPARDLLIRDN